MGKIYSELSVHTDSKVILLVLDGLGGLPEKGKTELEKANIPNLDRLAVSSSCGLTDPVSMGITPGSGPAHLSLFGYDPFTFILGRGILEALGIGIHVGKDDLVARANFATLRDGLIIDRRAGRIPTEKNIELCKKINSSVSTIKGAQVSVYPGKEHRFVIKFSKKGINDSITDADPQKENKSPVLSQALHSKAEESAEMVNTFISEVNHLLKENSNANTILIRGFSQHPTIPSMSEMFKLKAAAIANYPMYKGLAKLVGMDTLTTGSKTNDLFDNLEKYYEKYNFFYVHFKRTDSAGEDGNFNEKVSAIEEIDQYIDRLLALKADVLAITSDHSTPCSMKSHSWHPNPILIHAKTAQGDNVSHFTEKACSQGYLGRFNAIHVMPLLLAHAGKLNKYGA